MVFPLNSRTKQSRQGSRGTTTTTETRQPGGGALQAAIASTATAAAVAAIPTTDVVLFLFTFAIFALLISIFGPNLQMVEENLARSKDLFGHNSANSLTSFREFEQQVEVEIIDLPHEELFQKASMKSCIPQLDPKKCNEYIPEPIDKWKKKVQRVAVISPPGFSSVLLNHKTQLIATHYNRRHGTTDYDIDIITTSHVPPYGYGKTHGLTKIIRLIPQPLLLQVTDALHGILHETEHYGMLTLDDLRTALRHILYFHCRISHVAAHTALLSLSYDDLLSDPLQSARIIHNFLVPRSQSPMVWDEKDSPDDDHEAVFETQESWGSVLLSEVQQKSGLNVLDELDKVLLEELERTQNLTAWPCPSFWTAGNSDDPTGMSLFTLRLARDMSPRCNDEYSNCVVEKDHCESEGNVECEQHRPNDSFREL